jgi:hypothetical protein
MPDALTGSSVTQHDLALACDFDWTLDTFVSVSFLLIFVSFLLNFVPKDIPGEINTKFVNGAIAILPTPGLREVRIVLWTHWRSARPSAKAHGQRRYLVVEFTAGFAPSLTAVMMLQSLLECCRNALVGGGAFLVAGPPPKERTA